MEFSHLADYEQWETNLIFRSPLYAIVSNMTHFYILFGIREKMAFVEICVSPVLMQSPDIWNFYGSLTLNIRKLI